MSKILVVGHKNPDTDSIVSAIGAAELLSKMTGNEAVAQRAGEVNNETKFILQHFNLEVPAFVSMTEGDAVALVDHNEPSQVFDGLDYTSVDYIIDHHKMSVQTEKPILCRVEPIGSTSSLVAKIFFEKNIAVSASSAKVLLCGILSDTLKFTSPTTTPEDREIVAKLNEIAQLDIDAVTDEMFKAKSSLEGISTEDIISIDYKNFEMGSAQVGIGTWETTHPEGVNEKKDEIVSALIAKKESQNLDYIYFMVVDILQQNCQLYVVGEKEAELAKSVFGKNVHDQIMLLDGVVSRKKQIVPPLTDALTK